MVPMFNSYVSLPGRVHRYIPGHSGPHRCPATLLDTLHLGAMAIAMAPVILIHRVMGQNPRLVNIKSLVNRPSSPKTWVL